MTAAGPRTAGAATAPAARPDIADPRVARIVAGFEALQPGDVPALVQALYTPEARFKDPFNEVRGHAAIAGVYAHMFLALHDPRFVVHDALVQGERCFLRWDFLFAMRRLRAGVPQRIHGGSWLVLAPDGRIAEHRDYWDTAEELYEKLPLLGTLMRWVKRRANA